MRIKMCFFFVGLVNTVTMSACLGHLCVKIQQGATLLNSAVCSVTYASTTAISAPCSGSYEHLFRPCEDSSVWHSPRLLHHSN